jgi:hypothetical protein
MPCKFTGPFGITTVPATVPFAVAAFTGATEPKEIHTDEVAAASFTSLRLLLLLIVSSSPLSIPDAMLDATAG